jgi:hypothetical protein
MRFEPHGQRNAAAHAKSEPGSADYNFVDAGVPTADPP